MKLVVAKFQDTTTYNGWAGTEAIKETKPKVCYAAGWLVSSPTDSVLKIALVADGDKDAFNGWVNIPRVNVEELSEIKEVDWNDSQT